MCVGVHIYLIVDVRVSEEMQFEMITVHESGLSICHNYLTFLQTELKQKH